MSYNEILTNLKGSINAPITDVDAVNIIAEAYVKGTINEEEKEKLFDFIY